MPIPLSRLSDSAAQVLRVLAAGEQVSRPELSERLGVTAPTIAAALVELTSASLITRTGSRQGRLGRAAALYTLDARAGWVLGIDLGSTQVLMAVRTLGGDVLDDFRYSLLEPGTPGDSSQRSLLSVAADRIGEIISVYSASHGPLRSVGVALARVIPNSPTRESVIGFGENATRVEDISSQLGLPTDVPLLLENNVNCAALAEMTHGAATLARDFVYLQIGVRIGAGLIVDGKLRRGASGASGELSELPFPLVPASDTHGGALALESYLGSDGLLERTRLAWTGADGAAPATSRDLIALAVTGNDQARRIVEAHAADIAQVALVIAALVDPELIVLGGGVGQNPILADLVERALHARRPNLGVALSELGERATVEGAAALAMDFARAALIGDRYRSRLGGQDHAVAMSTTALEGQSAPSV